MKKTISFLIIFTMLAIIFLPCSNIFAASSLITVNGKTIMDNYEIKQVNDLFGKPKIQTDSPFGGSICSYYDDNYSYYLYIETDNNDKIKAYGAINGDFKTNRYTYGEKYKSSLRIWRSRCSL